MVRFFAGLIARHPVVSGAVMFVALMVAWRFGAIAIVDNFGWVGVVLGLAALLALGFILDRASPQTKD